MLSRWPAELEVFTKVYESYAEAQQKRNSHIVKRIDETLKKDEAAILLIREGHPLQLPSDIQVFYIAPPGLDRIKRWFRAREAESLTEHDETDERLTL